MGWPSCCRPGCNNWPAGSRLLLCKTCIKVPEYVHAEHQRIEDMHKQDIRELVESSQFPAYLNGMALVPIEKLKWLCLGTGIPVPSPSTPEKT